MSGCLGGIVEGLKGWVVEGFGRDDSPSRPQDYPFWLFLVLGCWFLVPGSWFLVLCSLFLVVCCLLFVVGSLFFVLGCLLLVVGSWLITCGVCGYFGCYDKIWFCIDYFEEVEGYGSLGCCCGCWACGY